ncbi:hypothetical protein D5086_015052 [Populus alba]|uniref:Uncharacterized protein n=1 Tax=Populus alba TaxID=43335 RepID=A0ACC4BZX9_POPAL
MLSLLISLLSQQLLVVGFRESRGLILQFYHGGIWPRLHLGRKFSNPIGLAAGFDKNVEAVERLIHQTAWLICNPASRSDKREIQSNVSSDCVRKGENTPLFPVHLVVVVDGSWISENLILCAIINRWGFNSEGIVAVAKRLGAQHGKRKLDELQALHLPLTTKSYMEAKLVLAFSGSIWERTRQVINVSSPNTPGLCMLQGRKQLKDLVKKVQAARDEMQWGEEGPPPLLVKIAPDLSKEDLEDIAAVSLALRLDGLMNEAF